MVEPGGKEWRLSKRQPKKSKGGGSWVEVELEYDPDLKVGSAGRKPRWNEPREPGVTRVGVFAAAVVALAIVALVLNFTLPWITFGLEYTGDMPGAGFGGEDEAPRGYDREEMLGRASDYDERLIEWPVVSCTVLIVAGLVLLGADLMPGLRRGVHRVSHGLLLSAFAFFGFLLALTGTRWLGQYFAYLMGDSTFSFPDGGEMTVVYALNAVPYVNLVLGLGVLAGAVYFFKPDLESLSRTFGVASVFRSNAVRLAAFTTAACAGGLLLMPLLPMVTTHGSSFSDYLGEATFALLAQSPDVEGSDLDKMGGSLALVRIMAWIMLYLSIVLFWFSVGAGLVPRQSGSRDWVHVYAFGAVPIVLAGVFLVRFYVLADGFEGLSIFANPFLPLTVLAMAAVYGYYVARVLLPFLRTVRPPVPQEA